MREMMRMFNDAMFLPITTFTTGMEMMARAVDMGRDMWRWTECLDDGCSDRCGDGLESDDARCDGCRRSRRHCSCGGRTRWGCDDDGWNRGRDRDWNWWDRCDDRWDDRRCGRRRRRRSDTVKLVEYSLVNVRRGGLDREPLAWGERVITDDVTEEELRNEIIVDWVQKHGGGGHEARNLRVYLRVLACWCKSDYDYEDEEIEELRGIRRALERKHAQDDTGRGRTSEHVVTGHAGEHSRPSSSSETGTEGRS